MGRKVSRVGARAARQGTQCSWPVLLHAAHGAACSAALFTVYMMQAVSEEHTWQDWMLR